MSNPPVSVVLDLRTTFDRYLFIMKETPHPELNWYYKKNLKKNSVVFDIGSSNGYFAMLAARIAPRGSIHAFEPVPDIYKNFRRSIQVNHINNITPNQLCVGEKDGTMTFYIATNTDTSGIRKTEHQKEIKKTFKCTMTRLDTYCRKKKISKIDLIKIDVEGNELSILTSSRKLLSKYKPVLIVEFSTKTSKNFGYAPGDLYDFFTKLGYRLYYYENNSLKRFDRTDDCDINVFCLP
ncbi:MAG: FkbM family methyltransferase [Candidatus Roizmanbacteria bacterium]|nr:FkbM family methyltransferase [Candidatus Roizmanbacteria bacterium]